MDVDFSKEAREFLDSHPQEAMKKAPLEDRVSSFLEAKASIHNEKYDQKVSLDQLKSVFNRGQAVTDWVYCANKSTMQWAFARVNNFLHMNEGKKVAKAYRVADRDIAEGELEYEVEDEGRGYFDYNDLSFAVARIDLKKAGISDQEANRKLENFVGLKYESE